MTTSRLPKTVVLLAASGLFAGCAQTDSIFPRRTTLSSLKTSVSHLEFENERLRRQVAQLETDSRAVEDRLVQEERDNGELKARLDDARYELSKSGIDFGRESANASRRGSSSPDSTPTIPAGRSNRKPRKPPFARIPGRIDGDPADEEPAVTPKTDDEFGPQSLLQDDTQRWLPVARGATAPSRAVR